MLLLVYCCLCLCEYTAVCLVICLYFISLQRWTALQLANVNCDCSAHCVCPMLPQGCSNVFAPYSALCCCDVTMLLVSYGHSAHGCCYRCNASEVFSCLYLPFCDKNLAEKCSSTDIVLQQLPERRCDAMPPIPDFDIAYGGSAVGAQQP